MPLSERDIAQLWDMLEAARMIVGFVEGLTLKNYLADRKLQLAIERLIEIIGEAARGISEETRNANSDIPWRGIIAQRNVLAHEYGEIKQERIWNVATRNINTLIDNLVELVPPDPDENE